jgi:methylase of polypeptide subunit release factors
MTIKSLKWSLVLFSVVVIVLGCVFPLRSDKSTYHFVKELGVSLEVLDTVFAPNLHNLPMRQFLVTQDLGWAKSVLEIGSGSGVLSLIALERGAGKVVATDINPNALESTLRNARRLNLDSRLVTRQVSQSSPGAFSVISKEEKFDLIISNLPWYDGKPQKIDEYAILDENYLLLDSLLGGLADHLTPGGKSWVELGAEGAISTLKEKIVENKLTSRMLFNPRPSYAIIEITL